MILTFRSTLSAAAPGYRSVKHQFPLMGIDVLQIPGKTWWVRYSEEHGWGCTAGDGPLWFKEQGNFMRSTPLLRPG